MKTSQKLHQNRLVCGPVCLGVLAVGRVEKTRPTPAELGGFTPVFGSWRIA